jgi:hypothetical protein
MKIINDLTAEYVRSILEYNPETGEFRWKWREGVSKRINARYAGTVAGDVTSDGYLRIGINASRYQAHRIAWLIVYGGWPPEQIDHIDCDRLNNRIANLRLATCQENMRNAGLRKTNTTGVTGVFWRKDYGKFQASIRAGGKRLHLGYHDTLEAATAARHAAEIEHFGEFRRAA